MQLGETFKRSFVAGLVLVAPLVVTAVVLRTAFDWLLVIANPVVTETRLVQYTGNVEVAAQLLAIVLLVATVTAMGYIAQRGFGQRVFGRLGRVMDFVPLVSVIYGSVRQVATSLVDRSSTFENVVLVEFPRDGIYVIGFVTGRADDAAVDLAGEPVHHVFLPNSPNPTAGRLVLVPESRLNETDMTARQGIRTVVTTGMGERADPTMLDVED